MSSSGKGESSDTKDASASASPSASASATAIASATSAAMAAAIQADLLSFKEDKYGMGIITLRNHKGGSATVSLLGAQVLSWKTERDEELLFLSTKAVYEPPHPVRGGIPICFPQFGNKGILEQHGFARKRMWLIDPNPPPIATSLTGKTFIDFLLQPSRDDMKIWPHNYEFRERVCLADDGSLTLTSRVRNVDNKNFSFSVAFHTYFSVSDISEVRVEGLETLDYLDNLFDKKRFTEQGDSLTFESEVDRVYVDAGNEIAVRDHQKKRTFVIRKFGLPDIVVWNPWEKKAKAIVDLADEEYRRMLCVDGAAVEKPITLKPGEEWTGRLELSLTRAS